ncbi:MAG: Mrp/NBP35 family ATP-binding protein [Bacteroidales bacterium]|nr:Mrp/NBP35 family ATP-binding protein [Bacteroidales bacterium]
MDNNTIQKTNFPNIKNIIIVASGKGGVGKSTVAAGLAVSLAMEGYATGLLDADIYGPSAPALFGLKREMPYVEEKDGKTFMIPFINFGVKVMSIGFFLEQNEAVIWRGPRASTGLSQLLKETSWGELDYLIIDTPPGTGDVHITLLQNFMPTGVIVVTTPQDIALSDVKKAINMYKNDQIGIPVLGIVENMSWFSPTQHPDEKYYIFGQGGGEKLAKEFNVQLLAQIPMNEQICESCDTGKLNGLFKDPILKSAYEQLTNKLISSCSKLKP